MDIQKIRQQSTENRIAWNTYVGLMWQHLFEHYGLPKDGTVVEVAPGTEKKIGNGLKGYEFSGTLYVVEPVKVVCDTICKKYEEILRAKIIPICGTLEEATKTLSERGITLDFIVANHPLDDMVMGKTLTPERMLNFFSEHYAVSPEGRRAEWQEFEKYAAEAKAETIEEWTKAIQQLSPAITIISQYESYYFRDHKIEGPDRHAYDVLKAIANKFKHMVDTSVNSDLAQLETNPDRWLVLKK